MKTKELLTKRQVEALNKIKEYHRINNDYPSMRTLGKIMDIKSPNGVKRHIDALIKKEYIVTDKNKYLIKPDDGKYIDVQVLGYANAGLPIAIAEENPIGTITLHLDDYKNKKSQDYFALIIEGDSMNMQKINNKYLKNNSYAIIKKEQHFKNGDTILAVINNVATVKNIVIKDDMIVLYPNSDNNIYREIYISKDDDFFINGKVVDVLPLIVK